jgi:transposase InsO family protein
MSDSLFPQEKVPTLPSGDLSPQTQEIHPPRAVPDAPPYASAGAGGGPERRRSRSEGTPPAPADAAPPPTRPLHTPTPGTADLPPPPPAAPAAPEEAWDGILDILPEDDGPAAVLHTPAPGTADLPPPPPTARAAPAAPEEAWDGILDILPEDDGPAAALLPDLPMPPLAGRGGRGRRLVKKEQAKLPTLTPQQRLLLLDTWRRSGLPAGDFAALVGVSKHTLYAWKQKFDTQGPAGLLDAPRGGPRGSQLPDLTKRTIVLLKETHPSWGCQRISDMLVRGPALPASPGAVARVLHEAGYELDEVPTRPHPDKIRHFERARPNQLWQTDLFTFILKRQNRRVYLVAFLDDHSRYVVAYGLHASQSSALVLEVLRVGLASYGTPEEILTDNGSQYVTWRGKSAFTKELAKQGIRQVVAAPRRPQTLGKIERFWGTLWRECLAAAVFIDLGDAQKRIGLFIDHYNFQRPHQGIDGLVPADRFFGAASAVRQTLAQRVAANALELARQGLPRAPFYLTGQVGGQPFSVHAEGERVILTGTAGARQEVDLVPPPVPAARAAELPAAVCPVGVVTSLTGEGEEVPPGPGASALDEGLRRLRDGWQAAGAGPSAVAGVPTAGASAAPPSSVAAGADASSAVVPPAVPTPGAAEGGGS